MKFITLTHLYNVSSRPLCNLYDFGVRSSEISILVTTTESTLVYLKTDTNSMPYLEIWFSGHAPAQKIVVLVLARKTECTPKPIRKAPTNPSIPFRPNISIERWSW